MGLFSRKKKIDVPELPSEDLLDFSRRPKPVKAESESVPKKIKKVVGLEEEFPEPEKEQTESKLSVQDRLKEAIGLGKSGSPEPLSESSLLDSENLEGEEEIVIEKPFFTRVQYYQNLHQSLDVVKINLMDLEKINEKLDRSEFNGNNNYEHLKKDLKKIHDLLLSMDESIFKH